MAQHVYIGTYTRDLPHVRAKAEGIYLCQFDPASGHLERTDHVMPMMNPSFLALSPDARFLYAAGEVGGPDGMPHGAVEAFARDTSNGELTALNARSSMGDAPCHVSVDASGRMVMAANYRSGSVAAYSILPDGSLGEVSAAIQHAGSSVNPDRQEGPHAHSINPDPTNRFALVPDLGADRVLVYRMDPSVGTLVPNDPAGVPSTPGDGPRHLDFHPNGRWVYVINELGCTITQYAWDAERGALTELQAVCTLPPNRFDGRNTTADIHVHPSGRFVYGSNRGHDSIAAFAVDPTSGNLAPMGHESTQGEKPRNFAIDPSGRWLLTANQDTDTIVTLAIDQTTGRLSPTGNVAAVPTPVCVRFVL
jgi:6-phosphogluconolactonase